MSDLPFSYQKIDSTTWAYLSSLLLVALFFKFNRFWSIRNLDLLLIVLLAPGLLMIESGRFKTAEAARSLRRHSLHRNDAQQSRPCRF